MYRVRRSKVALVFGIAVLGVSLLSVIPVRTVCAHCDTTRGPIISEAKAALENGDVTPVLKWIKKEHAAEIEAAFAKAVAVRGQGAQAKELADRFFLENLIRIHRAGEGAPYTGIKDEPVEPIVAMADESLANGSVDELIQQLSGDLANAIREKFNEVEESKRNKDANVEAGREFVEAYVTYTHYVEGVQAAIVGTSGHGHGGAAEASTLDTAEHQGHSE